MLIVLIFLTDCFQLADWYSISRKDVVKNGGRRIFNCYRSLPQALQTIYSDFEWDSTKFEQKKPRRKGLWHDKSYQRHQIERIGTELGVKQVLFFYTQHLKFDVFCIIEVIRLVHNSAGRCRCERRWQSFSILSELGRNSSSSLS